MIKHKLYIVSINMHSSQSVRMIISDGMNVRFLSMRSYMYKANAIRNLLIEFICGLDQLLVRNVDVPMLLAAFFAIG